VVQTNRGDPLHPVLTLVADGIEGPRGRIDTAARDVSGVYERHILETLRPPEGLDLGRLLALEQAAA
jgi:hypothetical protein